MSTASVHHALTQVAPRPAISGIPFDQPADQEQDNTSLNLKSYLSTLHSSRWLIGVIVAIFTFTALMYGLFAKSVYEANLIMHVEEESTNASTNILNEASSLFETKKTAIAEIELLRSRMVVSRSLDNLQEYIDIQPVHFPIIGGWIARQNSDHLSKPGLFGYGGYVWGAEKADVSLFNVPDTMLGQEFTLTALGSRRFRLTGDDMGTIFEGDIGRRYRIQTAEGPIDLQVDSIAGKREASFKLTRQSRLAMTEAVQNALVITEQGKQSGIIEVKMQGENPLRVYNVLTEMGREYMRQNLSRKTEEAEKSLAFLDQQLPVIKRQLEQAEDRYNQFRTAHNAVNLQEETRVSMSKATAANERRLDLGRRKEELLVRFTEDHPLVIAVNRQRREIDAEIARIDSRIQTMPVLEKDEARLARDIKVNADLYSALSNTAQQLKLTSIGRVSNVRMVDAPVLPEKPVAPKRLQIVVLAAVTGVFIGVLVAFARKAVLGGIDDPQKIERLLRARAVYATIPHSGNQDKLLRKAKRNGGHLPLLAAAFPNDPAIESLRSFRAALLFSLPYFKNNVIIFVGPTRGIGKSFVTANFAAVMAASGKRVLLIDSDLRNGQLNRYFGLERAYGLSDLLLGNAGIEGVTHHDVLPNLDFIKTGNTPPNSSELMLNANFRNLLDQTSPHYDLILLDTAPVLEGAESLILGTYAAAVYMIAHSGQTNEADISESIGRLNHAGISLQGVLLNDMPPRLGAYGFQKEPKTIRFENHSSYESA